MESLKKPLSVLIVVLAVVPLLTAASLLLSIRARALDRDFWVASLTDERLMEGVAGILSLQGEVGEGQRTVVGGMTLDSRSLSRGIMAAFPRDEYRALVEEAADALIAGKGLGERPGAAFDGFMAALSKRGDAFAAAYLEALPESEGPLSATDFSHRPSGAKAAEFSRSARPALSKAWETALSGPASQDFRSTVTYRKPTALFAKPRSAVEAAIAATLSLGLLALVGAAFLYGGPWAGRLVLMGTALIVSSITALLVGISLRIGSNAQGIIAIMARYGGPKIPDAVLSSAGGLMAWARAFLGGLAGPFLWTGIGGLSLGGLLVSLRWPLAARTD